MRVLAHIATVAALLGAFLVCPALAWADVGALRAALLGGDVDLVSQATAIQAAPDGHFTILVNRDLHPDADTLALWVDFLEGRDVPLIWEDVSAVAVLGDAAGIELAESLQSRLPEHQMGLRLEDGTLALSKAEAGRFDVLVLSDEAAAAYDVSALVASDAVEVVRR